MMGSLLLENDLFELVTTRQFKYALRTRTSGHHNVIRRQVVDDWEEVEAWLSKSLGVYGEDFQISIVRLAQSHYLVIYVNDDVNWRILDRMHDGAGLLAKQVEFTIENPMFFLREALVR